MSNIEKPEPAPETIDFTQLDEVTGGCRRCPCNGVGGVAYSSNSGFGIDPLFMFFALQLFSQNK